jgi:hypothetical protein
MTKRLLVLGAAVLVLAGVAASGAAAQAGDHFGTTAAFLCYSRYQVDPGAWPLARTSGSIHDTAADLLAQGYWPPYAETSVPTGTRISGGYYLTCRLPTGMSRVLGTLPKYGPTPRTEMVTQKGSVIGMSPKYADEPGLYPLVS